MKFFSVDSPLYKFISTFWVVVKLNFFWLLFSLPIVTIGASTTAAFAVGLKMADGSEGYIFQAFWAAFKENWKKGIPLGLLNLLIAYAVYLDFELFEKLEGNPFICLVMGILAIAIGISGFVLNACPHSFTKSNPRTISVPTILAFCTTALAIGSGRIAAWKSFSKNKPIASVGVAA